MNISMVIKRPIVTEKALHRGVGGRYTFEVDRRATRTQVAQAVESQFGVPVARVNTMIRKGKMRRSSRTGQGCQLGSVKRATVTLVEGQTIAELEVDRDQ